MNYTLFFLLLISISSHGQEVSVELFPESINDNSTWNITSPSMNDQENRLCFKKTLDADHEAIMISDKAADGKWSAPYQVIKFGEEDVFNGCALSADGNLIYFDLNNDIYTIAYSEGKGWGKPLLIGKPLSVDDTMEAWPSISRNDQNLSFIRNVRPSPDDEWIRRPFISTRNPKKEWIKPQPVTIKELKADDEVWAFYYDNESKRAFFFYGSSPANWGNYYAKLEDGVCTNLKKINFKDGYMTWINKNFTTGLIVTATQPSRIAKIKFSAPLGD